MQKGQAQKGQRVWYEDSMSGELTNFTGTILRVFNDFSGDETATIQFDDGRKISMLTVKLRLGEGKK